jgi:hypothetical protein
MRPAQTPLANVINHKSHHGSHHKTNNSNYRINKTIGSISNQVILKKTSRKEGLLNKQLMNPNNLQTITIYNQHPLRPPPPFNFK